MSNPQSTPPTNPAPLIPPLLHTSRLTLSLFSRSNPAHYTCLLSCLNNPTAYARMGDYGIRTPAQLDSLHTATRLTHPIALHLDLVYIIHLRSSHSSLSDPAQELTGPMVGVVTLGQRHPQMPPDIGWALLAEFMGKGYATEAAREFLRAAREEMGIRDVCTWPDESNRESNRVMEKLGFVEGGSVRVREEGKKVPVWILPGMERVSEGLEISFWGEGTSEFSAKP